MVQPCGSLQPSCLYQIFRGLPECLELREPFASLRDAAVVLLRLDDLASIILAEAEECAI